MNHVIGYAGGHWHGILLTLLFGANACLIVLSVRGLLHRRAVEKELARMNGRRETCRETGRILLIIWVNPSLVPANCPGIRGGTDHPDRDAESGRPGI